MLEMVGIWPESKKVVLQAFGGHAEHLKDEKAYMKEIAELKKLV